ncbi:MAG: sigma-70 family RNA polymerase sigma factor [Gammaproteobacteria bacterium]
MAVFTATIATVTAMGMTAITGRGDMETIMTRVAALATGASPGHESVILRELAGCVPLAGHTLKIMTMDCTESLCSTNTGRISRHRPEATLPIDQQKNRQLERFFIDWEERAFYIAYAALWDRESSLDAVQESMTRLIEYYRDKPAKEWPALFRTILNSKINDIRRRRMLEQGKHKLLSLTGLFQKDTDEAGANMEYELPAAGRDDDITAPEAEIVAAELRSKVADALQSLSERQRQVFILREWRGMTINETAQTLGCSENSVKQHHFRALRTLRVQLAEVWNHAQPTTS